VCPGSPPAITEERMQTVHEACLPSGDPQSTPWLHESLTKFMGCTAFCGHCETPRGEWWSQVARTQTVQNCQDHNQQCWLFTCNAKLLIFIYKIRNHTDINHPMLLFVSRVLSITMGSDRNSHKAMDWVSTGDLKSTVDELNTWLNQKIEWIIKINITYRLLGDSEIFSARI
jgi:hypothetical protein